MTAKRIVTLGATGLVGHAIVAELNQSETTRELHCVGRRACTITGPKVYQHICQLDEINTQRDAFSVDAIVLSLGASLQNGSDYQTVDLKYSIDAAKLAKAQGVKYCFAVSSALASHYSPSRYLRIKAKFEQALIDVGFEGLVIAQPGPLLGREQTRWQEKLLEPIFLSLAWLSGGKRSPIAPVPASNIARACRHFLSEPTQGVSRLSSAQLNHYRKS